MNFDSPGNLRVNVEGQKAQYSQTISITLATSGMGPVFGLWGTSGGGRNCRIQQVELNMALSATSGNYLQEVLIELYTSGFAQSGFPQIVSGCVHDPSDASSSGNLVFWSGIPLSGGWGKFGLLSKRLVLVQNLASGSLIAPIPTIWDWSTPGIKQPTLRNANQGLVVNLNSGSHTPGPISMSGVLARCRITWTEETNLT